MSDQINAGVNAQANQRDQQQENSPNDIEIPKLRVHTLKWRTPDEIQVSISALYQYAEANANSSIAWYGKSKKRKARISRGLRFLAILLTTIGGLTPILGGLGLSTIPFRNGWP